MKAAYQSDPARRVRQFWRAFFVVLALLGVSATALAAPEPLTGTYTGRIIGREITFERKGHTVTDWSGVLNLRLDNGMDVPIFCIEVDVLVRPGDRYRSDGPILQLPNGCQIRYLLDHYPASSAATEDEAAARQIALWVFSDSIDPATIAAPDSFVRDRAMALVNEAKAAPCPVRQPDIISLRLEPAKVNSPPGQTVTYTLSAEPDGAGQSVSVTLSGPALLENGQQQGSVKLNDQGIATFKVTSTGAGRSKVDVSLPYVLQAGTVFTHLDTASKTQRLVAAERRELVATATSEVTWEAVATATPSPTEEELPTATPAATQAPVPTAPSQQATPASTASSEQVTPTAASTQPSLTPTPQIAGGAGPTRPSRLPNTGASAGAPVWIGLGLAALLMTAGWLLRRRETHG